MQSVTGICRIAKQRESCQHYVYFILPRSGASDSRAHILARHRDILAELTAEYRRLKAAASAARDRASLLGPIGSETSPLLGVQVIGELEVYDIDTDFSAFVAVLIAAQLECCRQVACRQWTSCRSLCWQSSRGTPLTPSGRLSFVGNRQYCC